MLRLTARAALCALPGVVVLSLGIGEAAAEPRRSTLQYDQRVLRYDMENDKLYHASSSVTSATGRRPGGDVCYSGSRLDAYRYLGRTGQGGIYDALREDQARRKLDPKNYQHRVRYPAAR